VVLIQPAEFSSEHMKDMSPITIDSTPHSGFQDSGWKLLKDVQMGLLQSKRPEGVCIIMVGGFMGYYGGNVIFPW
jgi:hypothetical protein